PTYAEPFGHLAAMRAKQGYLRDAVQLMEKAVQFAPQSISFAERLAAYRALIESQYALYEQIAPADIPARVKAGSVLISGFEQSLGSGIATKEWVEIDKQLTQDGCNLIPALLDTATCAELRRMFDDDALFAKTVVMDRDDFGEGVYRYFKAPIPSVVD